FLLRKWVLELYPHECHNCVARRGIGRRSRIEELQCDAVALVDQRRITGQPAALALHGQRLGQIAEIPGPDASALERRFRCGEAELRSLPKLQVQCREVATGGELPA